MLTSHLHHRSTRGGALITALAFIVILSLLLAGMGVLVVSHDTLARRTADYAAAINLADAGINYELARISEDTSNDTLPNQQQAGYTDPAGSGMPGPYIGSMSQVPGGAATVPGSFQVWVSNLDGSGPWFAPAAALITSQGTVNGVTRTVQIQAARKSLFDVYALFSLNTATLNGSNTAINGSLGSNGTITLNSGTINGNVTFYGANPDITASQLSGGGVYSDPLPQNWPAVSRFADQAFNTVRGNSNGLAWIAANNNNDALKQFKPGDSTYSLANAVSANLNRATWTLDPQVLQNITTYNGTTYPALVGRQVLILEPGDYYFENLEVGSNYNTFGLLIDTASAAANPVSGEAGQVRIWMNWTQSGNPPQDELYSPVAFTSTDPSKFRFFYNKCSSLTISSGSTFNGSFYAVNPACLAGCGSTNCLPTISLQGGTTVNGSVIAENVTLNNSIINFPASGTNSNPADMGIWYGYAGAWQDITGLEDL